MTQKRKSPRAAIPGWRTAALAIAGTFSLAQCGGQARGTDPSPPDAAPEGAVAAKSESDAAADVVSTDAFMTFDAGVPYGDAGVPTGGLCPRMVDVDAGSDIDAMPPGGLCR